LDDSRKRGHVHLEFLHFSNGPLPTAAFPVLCEVGETIEPRSPILTIKLVETIRFRRLELLLLAAFAAPRP
jgi:hypothetical protein